MRGGPGKQPGEKPAEQYSAGGNHREFGFAARADDASQNQQGYRVCGEVSKGRMQEGRPNYPRQSVEVPGDNAIL